MRASPISFDGTWDIETEGWDKFVMGGFHTAQGTTVIDSPDDYFDALMALPAGTYWAHNGGRFDTLWLVEMLLLRGIDWTGALRGSAVIEVAVGDKRFRDSYAIFPEKLSTVAQAGGGAKIEVGLPCKCELACIGYCARRGVACGCHRLCDCKKKKLPCTHPMTCGGYCSIKRNMSAEHRAKVRDYLAADCEGLAKGLGALANYCARNEIELRTTVGATAWATCAKWIGLDTKRPAHTIALYRLLREAYQGGHNEVFGLVADDGNRYDMHSCYPAALSSVALPAGDIRSANPAAAYADGRDGVFTARVTVPDCHMPPLAMRTKERLVYCHGPISGTWTGYELRHAEECGARIEKIERGVWFERSEHVLKPYADRIWNLRERAKREETDGIYREMKWIGNSLTGKLAMLPTVVTIACYDEDAGMRPGETEILHKHGRVVVAKEVERVGSCAHVEWAAQLTSHARVELHNQLLQAGTDALYCDTDSVYTRGTLSRRVGDELGEWGHEGTMQEWQCLAPKIYRYWDCEKEQYVTRGKGMSRLHAVGFDALAAGHAWEVTDGVNSLKTAIQKKQGIFSRKRLSRKLAKQGDFVGSRRIDGTVTRAVTFREYEVARSGEPC